MVKEVKVKIIFTLYILFCFYGVNSLAHYLLPKWYDIVIGLPLSIYLMYRGILYAHTSKLFK